MVAPRQTNITPQKELMSQFHALLRTDATNRKSNNVSRAKTSISSQITSFHSGRGAELA